MDNQKYSPLEAVIKSMKKISPFTIIIIAIVAIDLFMVFKFFNGPGYAINDNQPFKTLPPTPKTTISASLKPSVTPKPSPTATGQNIIDQSVPFTAQAPFGEWTDPRQQDACEEASIIMAIAWVRGRGFTLQEAKTDILTMADWEQANYGFYQDTSAADTAKLMKDYFNYTNFEVKKNIGTDDILDALESGHLVIIPTNGQRLNNPNFTYPGPPVHMLVVKGYDYNTKEFITNDPGTRQGKDYRYDTYTLGASLQDYPTGDHHGPQISGDTAMIVVKKSL